jgi:hypothetical protein
MNERELRRDNERLIDAIDDILSAWEVRDQNGPLLDAITAARELIEDMGMEKPEWARVRQAEGGTRR